MASPLLLRAGDHREAFTSPRRTGGSGWRIVIHTIASAGAATSRPARMANGVADPWSEAATKCGPGLATTRPPAGGGSTSANGTGGKQEPTARAVVPGATRAATVPIVSTATAATASG